MAWNDLVWPFQLWKGPRTFRGGLPENRSQRPLSGKKDARGGNRLLNIATSPDYIGSGRHITGYIQRAAAELALGGRDRLAGVEHVELLPVRAAFGHGDETALGPGRISSTWAGRSPSDCESSSLESSKTDRTSASSPCVFAGRTCAFPRRIEQHDVKVKP